MQHFTNMVHKLKFQPTLRELLQYCTDRESPYWEIGWSELIRRYRTFIYSQVVLQCTIEREEETRQASDFIDDIVSQIYVTLCKNNGRALRSFVTKGNDQTFRAWLKTICKRKTNQYLRSLDREKKFFPSIDFETQDIVVPEGLRYQITSVDQTSSDNETNEFNLDHASQIKEERNQRIDVLWTKTIEIARKAADVVELTHLDSIVSELPEGIEGFLSQTAVLRGMVNEICELQTRSDAMARPFLREPLIQILCRRIENFCNQIAGFHEPLASEFGNAGIHWLNLVQEQLQHIRAVVSKEPSLQLFRAGDPVNLEQEAFVSRYSVLGDIERQIMLATGCPGLVLHGRRRVGKSTILRNLRGFLPDMVIPIVISMQAPQAFISFTQLISSIVEGLAMAFPIKSLSINSVTDLLGLFNFLSEYNTQLRSLDRRLLLAIDEYENLDRKLGEKIFPEDLLATIRESIQTHRNITWIFAGSHEITELKHAEWPSYLVSARTIEVPMFTMAETRLLLTEPLKFSPLFKDESKRPRFEPGFWGENGIERIQHEAGGWPHLVQLIAETVVDLINDETKTQVDAELFERSLNKAIVSGHNVLYQLMRGESTLPGEWEYLSAFRKRELQPRPENEEIYASLRRRLLVTEEASEWRLRVPLMARWLRERG